jgi:glycosyltransferase involved in cell wall biosynthesis
MKILQTCCSDSWGGLEITALRTAYILKERGHKVHLFCRKNSTLEKEASNRNIDTISLSENNSGIKSIRSLKRIISREKYDIVHSHLSHDLWVVVPALKFSGSKAKLFLSKHMGSGISKKDLFHRYLYGRVNHIFAVSNYVKDSVLKTCPVKENVISILYPSLNLKNYNSADFNKNNIRKEFNIDPKAIVIGMSGRFSPGKGQEEFLKAVKILKEEIKDNIFFIIAGGASFGEDKYEKKIHNFSKELGISDSVLFTGYRKDMARVLSAMDIFIFPSHEESFGITLTEAMALGLPVVASKKAGVLDIVLDGESGLLVEPRNAAALAEAIKKFIENPELRAQFGRSARKRAEEIFNAEDELNILEEYYAGKR